MPIRAMMLSLRDCPWPIAPIGPARVGINVRRSIRDVVGLFSRAAVGFPIGTRLKSKTSHKGAGLVETTPVADAATMAKPITPTVPPGIGITTIGRSRDVVGLFPRASIGLPCLARLEPEAPRKGASFLEGAPIADTTAIPKPIGPASPAHIGINLPRCNRNIVRLFSRAAVDFPIGARLKSKTPHKGASFIEGTPIAATVTIAKPIAHTCPPGIGISSIGLYRDVVGLFSRAAVDFPIGGRLKYTTSPKGAGFIEGAPITGRPFAFAQPIAHTCPPGIGISTIGLYWNVVGLFPRAAVGFPIGTRLKSKTPHKGAGFIEGTPITRRPSAVAQPIAHPCPTSIGINSIGPYRDVVGLFFPSGS